jgi:hypothetical protein
MKCYDELIILSPDPSELSEIYYEKGDKIILKNNNLN